MDEYTLLVLAAGEGSRFGGSKQIEPIGPEGQYIIDYSLYDAIKAGFNKVIFVIKEEQEKIFKETIGKRIEDKIKVEYAFQQINDLPEGYKAPKKRKKPWGTAHAIYSARDMIKGSFAIINADDFYGPVAYKILIDFLKNNKDRTHYLAVCYKVINTLSQNGAVKRAVVTEENGILEKIVESKVEIKNNTMIAYPLDGKRAFKLDENALATVNLFGLTVNFIKVIEDEFSKFLDENINNLDAEYLLPDVISKQIKENTAVIYTRYITDKWHGITYKEDKESIVNAINKYIQEGKYPRDLWK